MASTQMMYALYIQLSADKRSLIQLFQEESDAQKALPDSAVRGLYTVRSVRTLKDDAGEMYVVSDTPLGFEVVPDLNVLMRDKLIAWMKNHNACDESLEFVEQQQTLDAAWTTCTKADWFTWLLDNLHVPLPEPRNPDESVVCCWACHLQKCDADSIRQQVSMDLVMTTLVKSR